MSNSVTSSTNTAGFYQNQNVTFENTPPPAPMGPSEGPILSHATEIPQECSQFDIGVFYQSHNLFAKAIKHYEKVLEGDAEAFGEAQFNMAVCYEKREETAKALNHYDKVPRSHRLFNEAQSIQGNYYTKHNNYFKAIQHYILVSDSDPQLFNQTQLNISFCYVKISQLHQAMQYQNLTLKNTLPPPPPPTPIPPPPPPLPPPTPLPLPPLPTPPMVPYEGAMLSDATQMEYPQLDNEVFSPNQNLTLENVPSTPSPPPPSMFPFQLPMLSHATEMPQEGSQFDIGVFYQSQSLFAEAIKHYEKVLELDAEAFGKAQFNMAVCYEKREQTAKALNHYDKVPRSHRRFNEAQAILGNYYTKHNNYSEAIQHYLLVSESDPQLFNLTLFDIGFCYGKLNKFHEAMQSFKKVHKTDSMYWLAIFNIGACHVKLGEFPEGIKNFHCVPPTDSAYALAQFSIGSCYYYQKNYSMVIKHCESLRDEDPDSEVIRPISQLYDLAKTKMSEHLTSNIINLEDQ